MNTIVALVIASPLTLLGACSDSGSVSAVPAGHEPIVGLPCEGCEGVFVGMPEEMVAETRIAPVDEPGEALVLTGIVRDGAGEAVPGVVVYAYHTDAEGIYPRPSTGAEGAYRRHGTLRAWAKTDESGRYTFRTIRPGSYPNTTIPQHIHMHIIEPGRCTYYIEDVFFEDDPYLDDSIRNRRTARGGRGLSMPERDEAGVWRVTRDITLGAHIPGYPDRG